MRLSRRSEVDPVIVMDVMEAAARAEAAGGTSSTWRSVSPARPHPLPRGRRLAEAMEKGALGYTVALGSAGVRDSGSRGITESDHGCRSGPGACDCDVGVFRGAFLLAFTALFDAGDRVALGAPGYPSYRQILQAP